MLKQQIAWKWPKSTSISLQFLKYEFCPSAMPSRTANSSSHFPTADDTSSQISISIFRISPGHGPGRFHIFVASPAVYSSRPTRVRAPHILSRGVPPPAFCFLRVRSIYHFSTHARDLSREKPSKLRKINNRNDINNIKSREKTKVLSLIPNSFPLITSSWYIP